MTTKPRQRQAVLLRLVDAMHEHGSWCGETHLQKATYFLEELAGVPLNLPFLLYKYGPYSFDLRDELTAMRADGLLEMRIQPPPYSPSLATGSGAKRIMELWPRTLAGNESRIAFVAGRLGRLGVTELERLGTALFVTREPGAKSGDDDARARRIHELKPHVSVGDARGAIADVDRMIAECGTTVGCARAAAV